MARIRTIKPEFWADYQLAREFSRDERLFYIALWNEADDEGRFAAHPRRLLGTLFPYDEDIEAGDIAAWLRHLAESGRLELYEVSGEPYGYLTKFNEHQKINKPSKSRLPSPSDGVPGVLPERSRNATGKIPEAAGTERDVGKGREGRTTSVLSAPAAVPPNVDAPVEQPGSPEAELHTHRSQAAGIVRRVYWQGNDPPPAILRKYPGWSMDRELSAWNGFVDQHVGEYSPTEINAGLEVVRDVLDFGPDPPLSLLVFNEKGRRDKLRLCVEHARQRAPPEDENKVAGHIGDLLREVADRGKKGNRTPMEPGGRGNGAGKHAH